MSAVTHTFNYGTTSILIHPPNAKNEEPWKLIAEGWMLTLKYIRQFKTLFLLGWHIWETASKYYTSKYYTSPENREQGVGKNNWCFLYDNWFDFLLLEMSIRKWDCPKCGTHHDWDINASINLLAAGLAVSVCGATVKT